MVSNLKNPGYLGNHGYLEFDTYFQSMKVGKYLFDTYLPEGT